jgi:uncharacterized protein (TIGR02452 family)
MSSKTARVDAANQTLQAFNNGFYEIETVRVDLRDLHEKSLNSITLYTPEMINRIKMTPPKPETEPVYRLSSLPVVSEFMRTKQAGGSNIGILNFASAKNAGGGFLSGALAQEESLAMCSNLYLTQMKKQKYYESNRACSSMLYTDYMIYSKDVVFIREDTGSFWQAPLIASILTAPAANMGQYIYKKEGSIEHAEKVMKDRIRKILHVFAEQKNDILILGAYGCGVFKNDPLKIAAFFVELLKGEGLEKYFQELIFAVYDSSKDKWVYNEFSKKLLPLCKIIT